MTIPLTGSGGLFTRLGALFAAVADCIALQGGPATARVLSGASMQTRLSTLESDWSAGTSVLGLLAGDNGFGGSAAPLPQAVSTWQSTFTSYFQTLQAIAQNTLIKMADADAGGLQQRTLAAAMQYLVSQMQASAETVNATTVSVGSQTAVGTPNGNAVIVLSAQNGAGQTLQYGWGETLTFKCSADAQTGSSTAGQEVMTITGQAAVSSQWSYLWPGGSGLSTTLNATDAGVSNSGASPNVLQNSSFETYSTANVPDNWTISMGTAGTQVQAGTSANAYKGSNSVAFVGDATTLTAITQLFGQTPSSGVGTGGTAYKVLPQTPYCVNGWLKLSAASPAAGVLEVALVNSLGTILQDSAGNACSTTVNLHTIADTSWHNWSAVFRLPAVLPSQVYLRIRLSTALSTGTTVYVDGVAMNPMRQLYAGGPYCAIFSGNSSLILGDSWTMTYTPTWGAVQQYLERVFGMKALGLQVPSATSSPTVADSVIA